MAKRPPSKFSATMIGIHDSTDDGSHSKAIFVKEAREVSQFLQGVHHSRKIAHQQVNYSDTVTKLNKFQKEVPVYPSQPPVPAYQQSRFSESNIIKINDYNARMSENIRMEREINERKRLYNREVGRTAVVNQILAGTAPIPKSMIYPQKATHTQILAMTGNLKAPNANIMPPEVKRNKKWLGDGVGWES